MKKSKNDVEQTIKSYKRSIVDNQRMAAKSDLLEECFRSIARKINVEDDSEYYGIGHREYLSADRLRLLVNKDEEYGIKEEMSYDDSFRTAVFWAAVDWDSPVKPSNIEKYVTKILKYRKKQLDCINAKYNRLMQEIENGI